MSLIPSAALLLLAWFSLVFADIATFPVFRDTFASSDYPNISVELYGFSSILAISAGPDYLYGYGELNPDGHQSQIFISFNLTSIQSAKMDSATLTFTLYLGDSPTRPLTIVNIPSFPDHTVNWGNRATYNTARATSEGNYLTINGNLCSLTIPPSFLSILDSGILALYIYTPQIETGGYLSYFYSSRNPTSQPYLTVTYTRFVNLDIWTTSTSVSSISITLQGSLGSQSLQLGQFTNTGHATFSELALSSDLGNLNSILVTNSDPAHPWAFSTIEVSGFYSVIFGQNIRVKRARLLDAPISVSFSVSSDSSISGSSSKSSVYFGFNGPKYSAAREITGPFTPGQTITKTFNFINIRSLNDIIVRSYSIDDLEIISITITFKGVTRGFVDPTGGRLSRDHSLRFNWNNPSF